MHVAAVARKFIGLARPLNIQHNELRVGVIQRVLKCPIADGQRVAVAGDIVARYAVFFPHLHRKNAGIHDAVAEEQHIVFPRAVKKRLHLFDALLALDQLADARHHAQRQRTE